MDTEKKVVIVTDRFRTVEKILNCDNLEDFLIQGNILFNDSYEICFLQSFFLFSILDLD